MKPYMIHAVCYFSLISLLTVSLIIYGMTMVRIAFAEEQIEIFMYVYEKSNNHTSVEIEDSLDYIENYYPSGTKQVPGSPLDNIVEMVRNHIKKDLTFSLKNKRNVTHEKSEKADLPEAPSGELAK